MKAKWLIEKYEADNKYELLFQTVLELGYEAKITKYIPFGGGEYHQYNDDDCVVVICSINLARQLQKEKRWVPGPWLNSPSFECSKYYAYLGKHHVNSDYTILPRAELPRNLGQLRKAYGDEEALFIRPSSGSKTFTGKVFLESTWKKDWEWVEEFTDPESLIIISSPKILDREWRFIIANGEILTGSLYKERVGHIYTSKYREVNVEKYPKDLLAFKKVKEIISEGYHPDPMYVVDVCEYDQKMYLLEIGSFSCAGLYDCNLAKIVEQASNLAEKEWKDIYLGVS